MKSIKPINSLPHARGGVSFLGFLSSVLSVSSPRTWGCFSVRFTRSVSFAVFPTHVGVFLGWSAYCTRGCCLPHARGGVSELIQDVRAGNLSSPRTWGCFLIMRPFCFFHGVFPTHVGVFPVKRSFLPASRCLPHARGGVSGNLTHSNPLLRSSPRTWGCFPADHLRTHVGAVFPTHVGVFPCLR